MSDVPRSFAAPLSSVPDLPVSDVIDSLVWLSDVVSSEGPEKGDTFPVTWLADDSVVSAAGDPVSNSSPNGMDTRRFVGHPPSFGMEVLNEMEDFVGWGGDGPKPTGMLAVNGTVYLAAQNIPGRHTEDDAVQNWGHGYDAHVFASRDGGRTWSPSLPDIAEVMFPGRSFGGPAFINFGRENEHAVDGFAYALSGVGWDNGSECFLGRVPLEAIQDRASWEFVAGFDADGAPSWSRELADAIAVLRHPGYLGTVDIAYLHTIKRYLLLGWRNKVKAEPGAGSELIVYEGPSPWGPFSLVHHEDPWETAELNPYNPRLPLKWYDHGRNEGWLLFSGNWREGGSTPMYRAHARKFRLNLL
jgi:hypothetical protein